MECKQDSLHTQQNDWSQFYNFTRTLSTHIQSVDNYIAVCLYIYKSLISIKKWGHQGHVVAMFKAGVL